MGRTQLWGKKVKFKRLASLVHFLESFSARKQVSPPSASVTPRLDPCLPLPGSAELQSSGPCSVPSFAIFFASPPVAPPVGALSTPGPGCRRPAFHLSLSLCHPAQSPSSADVSVEKVQVRGMLWAPEFQCGPRLPQPLCSSAGDRTPPASELSAAARLDGRGPQTGGHVAKGSPGAERRRQCVKTVLLRGQDPREQDASGSFTDTL